MLHLPLGRPAGVAACLAAVRSKMTNRLYVGNLVFHATETLIHEQFSTCGEVVSVSVVTDRDTGRSRGFAFVEMANAEGARKAIAELDGRDLEGRALRVREAEERQRRDDRGGSNRAGWSGGGGRRRGG
jgi:RNA recognition motif-containing protein